MCLVHFQLGFYCQSAIILIYSNSKASSGKTILITNRGILVI